MKVCTKCKESKDESEFYKDKSGKNGLSSICKKCRNEQCISWQKANVVKTEEYTKKWRVNNTDKYLDRMRQYKKENQEGIKKWRKEHYQQNRNEILHKKVSYYKDNKDKLRNCHRENQKKGRDKVANWYIKDRLKKEGYTEEQINRFPTIIDVKRIKILTKRIKKQNNESKHRNADS